MAEWLLRFREPCCTSTLKFCPNCLPDVCRIWFPRCCLPVASKISTLFVKSSTCLPDVVSQLSFRCGFPGVVSQPGCCLLVFYLSPRCCPKMVLQLPSTIPICLPELVVQLFPSVFHLSPRCFPVVFQMLFPTCHLVVTRLPCKCGLPIVSQFVPDVPSQFSPSCLPLNPHNAPMPSRFSPKMVSQLRSNCFQAVSQMWSSNCLPIVSFSLEFETVIAVGLQSWVNCVRLSGCLSSFVSVSLCLPLWLLLSHSLDFSCYGACFRVSLHASPALANGFLLSGCLFSLVSLCLCPSLASDLALQVSL